MAKVKLTQRDIERLLRAIERDYSPKALALRTKLWAAKRELRAKDAAKEPTR